MKKRRMALPQVPRRAARAMALIIVRESSEKEKVQFDGMREQTYQLYRSKPEVEAVRKVGLAPWFCDGSFRVTFTGPLGQEVEEEVFVETRTHGRTKAILFGYRDHWHLWSMASAYRESIDGVNEFTEILVGVIKKLRPRELMAANISRLVRSQHQATRLQFVMRGRVDRIIAGGQAFELAGKDAYVGTVLFQTLAMVAAMERDMIVQRTAAGLVARWRRGAWPHGRGVAPYGYRYDTESQKLRPVESLRPVIAQMLRILASEAPPSEQQQQLADLGLMTRGRYAGQETVDVIRDPQSLLRTINAWASVYLQGEYLLREKNGFRHADEISGVSVMRYAADDLALGRGNDDADGADDGDLGAHAHDLVEAELAQLEAQVSAETEADILPVAAYDADGGDLSQEFGELQMLVTLDVPDGGWADPGTLAAYAEFIEARGRAALAAGVAPNRPVSAAVLRDSVNPAIFDVVFSSSRMLGQDWTSHTGLSPSHARRHLLPFAGREWYDEAHQFALAPTNGFTYVVWRWGKGRERRSYNRSVRLLSRSQRHRRGDLPASAASAPAEPGHAARLGPQSGVDAAAGRTREGASS